MKCYRIDNWSEYNKALVQRGSLNIWVDEKAVKGWLSFKGKKKRGRPQLYSDDAILMLMILREVYHIPLRAVQGMAQSIFFLMRITLPVPCYTQVCRRAKKLGKILKRLPKKGKIDVVFDSTGLKVYGEGEWKVRAHGAGKRRTWKKLHIGIDPSTQEILMCELTDRDGGDAETAANMLNEVKEELGKILGDGAYDSGKFRKLIDLMGGEPILPPPKNAAYKGAKEGWQKKRDDDIAEIYGLGGNEDARKLWKKIKGYHQRSLVETAMYRIKQILGGKLKSRSAANQAVEAQCKCLIMNKMKDLGFPKGEWVEGVA
jgi:hypothetical protein